MLSNFLASSDINFGTLGVAAAIVSIVVEVLKGLLPSSVPTKLVTMVTSLLVCVGFCLISYPIGVTNILMSIGASLVVAFVSMNGFDSFKEIIDRYKIK